MTDVTDVNPSARTVFGHPIGLVTLFLTEMWERMSYYGMRALLLLFMVDMVENDGLALPTSMRRQSTACIPLAST